MINLVSLNTIVKDLLLTIRGSKLSQSENISERQLESWVHMYRGILIKQDLDKGKMPNPDYIQEIPAIRLIKVDKVGRYSNISANEYTFRTDIEIPKTIDLNFKSGIMFVGTLDGQEIQLIPQSRAEWKRYKKFSSRETVAYLKNGYIFIDGVNSLNYISLRGVFEIPTEINNMYDNTYTTLPTYSISDKYPIPINMIPTLKEMILKKELNIMVSAPIDDKNDSQLKLESQQINN